MKKPVASLLTDIESLPSCPGVYLFKDAQGAVCYIGKAKSLRDRVRSYVNLAGKEWKSTTLMAMSTHLEHVVTNSELEAMLLEAKLIQSYQPLCNVLLKTGQPYLYFLITQEKLPRFIVTSHKKQKGTYFGPFIERTAARKAHRYLEESLRLYLCKTSVTGGCLAYHMGRCAGLCRPDFDEAGYRERLALLADALTKGRAAVIERLHAQLTVLNQQRAFERSAEVVRQIKAFEQVFSSLETKFDRPQSLQRLADKDVWIVLEHAGVQLLMLFRERNAVLTKQQVFYFSRGGQDPVSLVSEYIESYYRLYRPSQQVLCNVSLESAPVLAAFVTQWHELPYTVTVSAPAAAAHGELMALATLYAQQERARTVHSGVGLQRLLSLPKPPRTIDCVDISHKQGHAMVGACVRFTNGVADTSGYRLFTIKSLDGQDDYAALQEVVTRRYREIDDLPDLLLVDGGKGQLAAVRAVCAPELPMQIISLAKREETIFSLQFPEGKVLDLTNSAAQLLIALRDYAHHTAISFHRQTAQKGALAPLAGKSKKG